MDRLWAPWRHSYIAVASQKPDAGIDDCFMCRGLGQQADRENLLLQRRRASAVFLNRFPYNNGHLLVAPLAHKARLQDLTADEAMEIQTTLADMVTLLERTMQPEGFNIGLNLGRVSGAGVPGHLHWHIVPRWNGDTNFMPVLSDTKVIVQSLESLYDLLHGLQGRDA